MRGVLTLGVVLAALALAGPAAAHTWRADVGEQAKAPAGTPKSATLNHIFPAQLVVHVGDKVTFRSRGFHTVSFLAGQAPPGLFVPDGTTYTGIVDAAGAPFFFNSLPKLSYNVPAFLPFGGNRIDGSQPVSSGVIVPGEDGKAVSATFTFPKAGTYRLVCLIHPGMAQTVVVKPKAAKIASPKAVAEQIRTQTAAAWKQAKTLAATKPPADTMYAGIGGKTTLLAFLPARLTVKAGTTVHLVSRTPSEPHNIVFGPMDYIDGFMKQTDAFPTGPGATNQVTPPFAYGTEANGRYVYDGANHGNGFMATPLIDALPASPLPDRVDVTFTKPGSFHFFCLLHGPDMAGDVVVTP